MDLFLDLIRKQVSINLGALFQVLISEIDEGLHTTRLYIRWSLYHSTLEGKNFVFWCKLVINFLSPQPFVCIKVHIWQVSTMSTCFWTLYVLIFLLNFVLPFIIMDGIISYIRQLGQAIPFLILAFVLVFESAGSKKSD